MSPVRRPPAQEEAAPTGDSKVSIAGSGLGGPRSKTTLLGPTQPARLPGKGRSPTVWGSSALRSRAHVPPDPFQTLVLRPTIPWMGFFVVSFEEGGEVVQTVGLAADSPEDAIAEVERYRRERPELG